MIISMSGRKGAGKNTLSDFIRGWYAKQYRSPIDRPMTGEWKYKVDHVTLECSFADNLKEFCINTLGLSREQCYGTDDEKSTPTQYLWENVCPFFQWKFGSREIEYIRHTEFGPDSHKIHYRDEHNTESLRETYYGAEHKKEKCYRSGHRTGAMTGRDVMQIFGTELIRETFGNVWAKATIRRIKQKGKPLSIITDNRFPNEIEAVLSEPTGYIIRLTRSPYGLGDRHPSEASLDDYDWNQDRCFVLDNSNMDIEEQNRAVVPILNEILKRSEDV